MISQYLGYSSGRYLSFSDLNVAASRGGAAVYSDRSHTSIPFPKWSWGAAISYAKPVGDFVVTPSATFTYRSKYPSWLGRPMTLAPISSPMPKCLWRLPMENGRSRSGGATFSTKIRPDA
jgi:hypothetical protein